MKVELAFPLASATGEFKGGNRKVSLRNKFGNKHSYTWDPNYSYPQIAARVEQTEIFRETNRRVTALCHDEESLAIWQEKWRNDKKDRPGKNVKRYNTLRGYMMAMVRAEVVRERESNQAQEE